MHEGTTTDMSNPKDSQHSGDDFNQYGDYSGAGGSTEGKGAANADGGYDSGGYNFSADQSQPAENQPAAYQSADNAYYAGGYEAPQFGGFEAQQESKNPVAPWALGIGILSLVGSLIFLGSLLGVIGIILAIVSLVVGKKRRPENRRTVMSVVGLVTSILSVIVGVVILMIGVSFLNESGVLDCVEQHGDDEAAIEQCITDSIEQSDN